MSFLEVSLSGDKATAELAREFQRDFFPKFYRTIARELLPPLQRELDRVIDSRIRPYPPKKNRKMRWSNDPVKNARARRWYFANIGEMPYQRTGQLGRSWTGDLTFTEGLFTVSVENPSPGASYVFGSQPFGYAQVPGHAVTGWQPGNQLVEPVVLDFAVRLQDALDDHLDKYLVKVFK